MSCHSNVAPCQEGIFFCPQSDLLSVLGLAIMMGAQVIYTLNIYVPYMYLGKKVEREWLVQVAAPLQNCIN